RRLLLRGPEAGGPNADAGPVDGGANRAPAMERRFGDLVRILSTPETERAGLAGLVGQVSGETQPSVSGVEVIGGAGGGFPPHVRLDGREESHWFALDLVEFLDPRAGSTTDRLESAPKGRARRRTEEWQEKDLPSSGWQRFLARLRGGG